MVNGKFFLTVVLDVPIFGLAAESNFSCRIIFMLQEKLLWPSVEENEQFAICYICKWIKSSKHYVCLYTYFRAIEYN